MANAKVPVITVDEAGHVTAVTEEDINAPGHDLLSGSHVDTVTADPTRGDIIVANSIPKWARFAIGGSGTYLRSDGTDPAWSALQVGDLPAGGTWPLTSDLTLDGGHLKLATGGKYYERGRTTALGDWTDVTFDSGNFSAESPMSWSVLGTFYNRYMIVGDFCLWVVRTIGGTTSGTATDDLFLNLPVTAASQNSAGGFGICPELTGLNPLVWIVIPASTTQLLARRLGATYPIGTVNISLGIIYPI